MSFRAHSTHCLRFNSRCNRWSSLKFRRTMFLWSFPHSNNNNNMNTAELKKNNNNTKKKYTRETFLLRPLVLVHADICGRRLRSLWLLAQILGNTNWISTHDGYAWQNGSLRSFFFKKKIMKNINICVFVETPELNRNVFNNSVALGLFCDPLTVLFHTLFNTCTEKKN